MDGWIDRQTDPGSGLIGKYFVNIYYQTGGKGTSVSKQWSQQPKYGAQNKDQKLFFWIVCIGDRRNNSTLEA
jgi:phosphoglucomutase